MGSRLLLFRQQQLHLLVLQQRQLPELLLRLLLEPLRQQLGLLLQLLVQQVRPQTLVPRPARRLP
jgi:hypothetical protein